MPSTMFMIPSPIDTGRKLNVHKTFNLRSVSTGSIACWIAKGCTLLRRDNASLTWTGSILLFVNVKKISFSSNHSIRVCVKGKRINRGVGYEPELPAEYIF